MPSAYITFLKRIFFRLEVFQEISKEKKLAPGKKQYQAVLENLSHVDRTLDKIWEEASDAMEADLMNNTWRSRFLDRWLVVEFFLQRHAPFDIRVFEEKEVGNAALLRSDPFTLGIILFTKSYIFIHSSRFRLATIRCKVW